MDSPVPIISCLSMQSWHLLRRGKKQPLVLEDRSDSQTLNVYSSLKSLHSPAKKPALREGMHC